MRSHRTAADAARLAAAQTARLAEMDRIQAVVAERARMARELHDMVANHLSAVAIHSTAALSIDDPETSRNALKVIRENSVEGLAEMRRLIGLLREGGEDGAPAAAPTLASLDALVEQANVNGAAGGLVCVLEDARPAEAGPLPTPVELAAYRIVQESLTNALKHAAPGPVTVRLGLADEVLTVEVTSVSGSRPGPTAPGSGAGLVGIRERVALLGRDVRGGGRTDGGGTTFVAVRRNCRYGKGSRGNDDPGAGRGGPGGGAGGAGADPLQCPDIEVVGERGTARRRCGWRANSGRIWSDGRTDAPPGRGCPRPAGGGGGAGGRLVLTTFDLDEYRLRGAAGGGSSGFLLKNTDARDLLEAVRTVARGEGLIAPAP